MSRRRLAKLAKYRGEYDRWGNRYTKTQLNTKHLLQPSNEDILQSIQQELEDNAGEEVPRTSLDLSQYNLGTHYTSWIAAKIENNF